MECRLTSRIPSVGRLWICQIGLGVSGFRCQSNRQSRPLPVKAGQSSVEVSSFKLPLVLLAVSFYWQARVEDSQ